MNLVGLHNSCSSFDISKYEEEGQPYHNHYHLPKIKMMIEDYVDMRVPQILKEEVPKICADTMRKIVPQLMGAIQTDITSIVKIGFDNARDIWEDSRTQEYVSRKIIDELEKRLQDITYNISF